MSAIDDRMAALIDAASQTVDGTLLAAEVASPDVPAMTRACVAGLFEFRERPRAHYALTEAGWVAARTVQAA